MENRTSEKVEPWQARLPGTVVVRRWLAWLEREQGFEAPYKLDCVDEGGRFRVTSQGHDMKGLHAELRNVLAGARAAADPVGFPITIRVTDARNASAEFVVSPFFKREPRARGIVWLPATLHVDEERRQSIWDCRHPDMVAAARHETNPENRRLIEHFMQAFGAAWAAQPAMTIRDLCRGAALQHVGGGIHFVTLKLR